MEIHALFLEILRFEFVTLFVKHPVYVVTGGVPLEVRTFTSRRCISETARPITFKFAVRLVAHY